MTNTHSGLRKFWHPVALESDVGATSPLAVRLLGERWIVARLGEELVGMRDLCPHRKVPLSAGSIVGNEVQCGYHGYRFDSTGRATTIPALDPNTPIPPKACVDTTPVTVRFGVVWMSLVADPIDTFLDDAPFLDPVNDTFVSGPFTTHVSAGVLADNFLDGAHFPFLHAGTFGADDDGVPSLTVDRDGWKIVVHDEQRVDGAHLERSEPAVAQYTVGAPFAVELRLDRPDASDLIWSFACPVDDGTTLWWMVHAYPLNGEAEAITAARALQTEVGREDLRMLEQMEDPNLHLDVRAEVHTKADLGCLEYRRMMIDLAGLDRP
ncbi:MAG: phenylpropionate dioxygenase-like ring-hydroxylating dioxygenase large terminal subunit [Ilumatobacter sp.]|jgi:phenylpropionate dioxygenase-like ring-hydroxylating dioxygenase large terminal subunit